MCYDDALKCKFCASSSSSTFSSTILPTLSSTSSATNCEENATSLSIDNSVIELKKLVKMDNTNRSSTKSPSTHDECSSASGVKSTDRDEDRHGSGSEDSADLQNQRSMKAEIEAAVTFLTDLIRTTQFSPQTAERFRKALTDLLEQYYDGHWYPDEPLKGSGYRCLRVNGVMNPLLKKAAQLCNMPLSKFRLAFPVELTVWVDPGDVSVRFGEEGSIGVYYAKKGVCLKHDHHQMDIFQRLSVAAANSASKQRGSPSLATSAVVNNSGISNASGFAGANATGSSLSYVFNNGNVNTRSSPLSSYGGRSTSPMSYAYGNASPMKINSPQLQHHHQHQQQSQSPPRKILPFFGGRQTPTYQQQQQHQYQQMYGGGNSATAGYGTSPDHHNYQHHPLYKQHQTSPQQQQQAYDFGTPVRRPSPSPSPPEQSANASTIGDWWKSEYHNQMAAFGANNSGFGGGQMPHYGRFARMMNVCARQEPVGAN